MHLAKRIVHRNEAEPLQRALKLVGWNEAARLTDAKIVWDVKTLADSPQQASDAPQPHQLVNYIPAMLHCCRKGVFALLLGRLRALLPPDAALADGRYVPVQFALPLQAAALAEHIKAASAAAKLRGKPAPTYIVKPDCGSQGDGIQLTTDPLKHSWDASKERVVQHYIGAPMLLDGLKFDLRLYVLVLGGGASGGGPRAYLYREGLARFAVDSYAPPSKDNLRNVHMHLTNYSLNKKAEGFKHNEEVDGGDDGSKRTVSSVFAALAAAGRIPHADALWSEIAHLVRRALGWLDPILRTARTPQPCFQVLGLDVLLDRKARPWLIELNDHPSFRIDLSWDEPGQYTMNGGSNSMPSPVDEAIKVPMLEDVLRVVGAARGLSTSRDRTNDSGGAAGTHFFEVRPDEDDEASLRILRRLARLFERHTPPSARREATDPRAAAQYASSDPFGVPGPRWRGPASPFAAFLQTVDLVQARGASGAATARGALARHDVELIVLSVCGKGGTMDVLTFSEACARVAVRRWPEEGSQSAALARLLELFPEEEVEQDENEEDDDDDLGDA